jgi:quercetin dioxygenase-like cupin family protein
MILAPNDLLGENILVNRGHTTKGEFIDAHREDGYSFVHILEGSCTFKHDGVEFELRSGDVLYYDARYTHSVIALSQKLKFISIFLKGRK